MSPAALLARVGAAPTSAARAAIRPTNIPQLTNETAP
jgi:hypothetical protein